MRDTFDHVDVREYVIAEIESSGVASADCAEVRAARPVVDVEGRTAAGDAGVSVVEMTLGVLLAVLPLLAVWRLLGLPAAIFCVAGAVGIRAAYRRRPRQLWRRRAAKREEGRE